MENLNAYIVMTNGAINIVTTDPNVADQAKMKNPGSIIKRFPLTSKMAGNTGLVGEALDGDFELGADTGGSIGQDDVEFAADDDQSQDDMSMDDGDEVSMDDDDTADVICMNTELAVRVFEYIAQNQIDGEELQVLADKMADLGNQSDDVLTGEHFDEITGGDDQVMDDEFGSDDEFTDDGEIDPMSDDAMADQSNDDIAADLELGEDAFDDMDLQGRSGMSDDIDSELEFVDSESHVTDADEQLIAQFVAGQISREQLIDGLSHGSQDEYAPRSDTDLYGDDVSGDFDEFGSDDDDLEEDMQQPQGTQPTQGTQQQQQAPTQNPAQFDGAYMNGYNTAKRGGQAQQQNINTPQGSAYNRGFMDAKANKPSVPPSKQRNESVDFEPTYQAKVSSRSGKWYLVDGSGKRVSGYGPFDSRPEVQEEIDDLYKSSKKESVRRPVREGVETFGAYLAAMEKKTDRSVAPTIASLFKTKKQKAAETEKHFTIEQDPKTSAVKITNSPTVVLKR